MERSLTKNIFNNHVDLAPNNLGKTNRSKAIINPALSCSLFVTRVAFRSIISTMSFTSKPLSENYSKKLDKIFDVKDSFLQYNPGRFIMPPQYKNLAQQILDFEVREDDVWVISYPRTGSTWCQEMVWLVGNNLDFEGTKNAIQQVRAPVLELSAIFVVDEYSNYMKNYGNSVERLNRHPSPRFIKTHVPPSLLPVKLDKVKPKIVYIARNPKDMCVSYYHHFQHYYKFDCTFDDFCDLLLNDMVPFCPLWPHYLGFWNKRNEENVLFLKYEDLKRDLKSAIRQTAQFLNKTLNDDQVDDLHDYLSFSNMKNNRSVNMEPVLETRIGVEINEDHFQAFIRNGKVGDWKIHMSPEMSKRFDDWIEENTKGTGLTF